MGGVGCDTADWQTKLNLGWVVLRAWDVVSKLVRLTKGERLEPASRLRAFIGSLGSRDITFLDKYGMVGLRRSWRYCVANSRDFKKRRRTSHSFHYA